LTTSALDTAELNPAQIEAVEHTDGPLLILAGAGSGKTRVITHRVVHLIDDAQVAPWNILAVTFTNKAADEMRSRVTRLAAERGAGVELGTFHGVCARILRRFADRIGINRNFTIFDGSDQTTVVRTAMKDLGLAVSQISPTGARNAISRAKDELMTHHQFAEHAEGFFEDMVAKIYARYEQILNGADGQDFGDLIVSTVRLLREDEEVLHYYQDRFRYVMIDEYQDTNRAQYALVRELAADRRNLAVVGDDDQSIYGWRGADIRNLMDFEEEYPDARVVKLEQNYRSTQLILDAAHGVVERLPGRKEKKLWTERTGGHKVRVMESYDDEDEALRILAEVQEMASLEGVERGDFAIMYRTNAQSRLLEEAFVKAGMPYQLVGATEFYGRREVKDMLAYLRCLANPRDGVSFDRIANVPARGLGAKTLGLLSEWAEQRTLSAGEAIRMLAANPPDPAPLALAGRALKVLLPLGELLLRLDENAAQMPLPRLLQEIYRESGYEKHLRSDPEDADERIDNVVELIGASAKYADMRPQEAMVAFLQEVVLISDVDALKAEADVVTLITLHAAKGLEFKNVFITGFEEELCPHVRSFADPAQMEEERRLAYVGITRAQDRLFLSYAKFRGGWGSRSRVPSRFLQDIPEEILERDERIETVATDAPGMISPKVKPAVVETERSYHDGQKVRHPVFGVGVVVSGKIGAGGEEVQVAFPDAGIKLLAVAFANLDRL